MGARAQVVFRGDVQGVYFRANCRDRALILGLTGWVRNRADRTVEAVFEGEREAILEAVEWNRTFQPYARVSGVEVTWSQATGEFHTFEVRR